MAPRPRRRARVVIVVLVGAVLGWGFALTSLERPETSGEPGTYVTLGFPLRGEGSYEYQVDAPDPWSPLAPGGTVRVDGDGFVSVTVRVPRTLAAGAEARIVVTFRNRDEPHDGLEAVGTVRVLPQVAVDLIAPKGIEGRLDEPLVVPVTVRNAGNVRDAVTVAVASGMWAPRVPERVVELDAGEAREIALDLLPQGRVSNGFRQFVRISATSQADPEVQSRAFVEARFFAAGTRRDDSDAPMPAPEMTLTLRAGARGALDIDGAGTTASAEYSVAPRLSGELSDYVEGDASIGRLSGTFIDPFETVPSRLDVGLRAEAWDARVGAGANGYRLAAGGLVADETWRIGGNGGYAPGGDDAELAIGGYAHSQHPELDLQIVGATRLRERTRTDTLGARYRTRLDEGLTLRLGANVLGTDDDGYTLDLGVDESLSWQTQGFDVTQSYSGIPLAGLHTIGLNGGLRSVEPFGVRASTALRLEQGTYAWWSGVVLTARPVRGVGVSLRGGYSTASARASWRVSPAVSYRSRVGPVRTGLRASYAYTGALRGDVASESRYSVGADAGFGAWKLATDASYHLSDGGPDRSGADGWTVSAATSFAPTRGTTFEAAYEYEYAHEFLGGDEIERSSLLAARWRQHWTDTIRSEFGFERRESVTVSARERADRLALALNLRDVGVEGLRFAVGYALEVDDGLFAAGGDLRHELRGSVSYALALPFETPTTVIDAFGGRRGGEVRGVAYVDTDLDGIRDEDERAIEGMRVELGDRSVRTDADGRFAMRVPSGQHVWSFGPGVPARVEVAIADTLNVTDDSVLDVDLPFVPVVTVDVTLFDDLDDDGQRSADEPGIAFGGIRFVGPDTRSVRMDGRGNATVTGLVPGTYRVMPDPDLLPRRYRATTPEREIVLHAGTRPSPVVLGAGEPPKSVVTTYSGGSLAVMARMDERSAPAGGEVSVSALVSGEAEAVVATVEGVDWALSFEGSRWTGTVRIPRDMPIGTATIIVTATSGQDTATSSADVSIVDRPLVEPTSFRVREGRDRDIDVETAFTATTVELVIADQVVALASEDGRTWKGTLPVSRFGDLPAEGRFVVDGDVTESVTVELVDDAP